MDAWAYCAESFRGSVRRAAGVEPLTSPPYRDGMIVPSAIERRDLLYFDLHGWPGSEAWNGDGGLMALAAATVRRADLAGVTVFTAACYLDEESGMLRAFLEAGAECVIGGDGQNFEFPGYPGGANLLGMWLRRFMAAGVEAERALVWAKRMLRWSFWSQSSAERDALAFRLWRADDLALSG